MLWPLDERHRKHTRGPRGYDGGKSVTGRKRHLLVDTLGLILAVVVHAADIQDYDGLKLVFEAIRGRFRRLRLVWADGMDERMAEGVARWRPARPIRLQIVKRTEPGFKVRKRRWVVERTFAWLGRCRRLSMGQAGDDPSHGPPVGHEVRAFSTRSGRWVSWWVVASRANPTDPLGDT